MRYELYVILGNPLIQFEIVDIENHICFSAMSIDNKNPYMGKYKLDTDEAPEEFLKEVYGDSFQIKLLRSYDTTICFEDIVDEFPEYFI